jgi:hypothetical protein
VTERPSDEAQNGNEADEDGQENHETPAGTEAAGADEDFLGEPSEERRGWWLWSKRRQRFRRE